MRNARKGKSAILLASGVSSASFCPPSPLYFFNFLRDSRTLKLKLIPPNEKNVLL